MGHREEGGDTRVNLRKFPNMRREFTWKKGVEQEENFLTKPCPR